MLERRLGPGAYIGVFLLLAGGGVVAALSLLAQPVAAGFVGSVAYLMLVLPVLWRLNDLGRSPEDAVWMLLPPVGLLYAAFLVFQGKPSETLRERRIARWKGQLTGVGAFLTGLKRVAQGWWVAVPVVLLFATVDAFLWEDLRVMVDTVREMDRNSLNLYMQTFGILGGVAVVWSLVQLVKVSRVSRASWLPALLILPIAAVIGAGFFMTLPGASTSPGPQILLFMAWGLLSDMLLGGALAVIWVALATQLEEGRPDPRSIFRQLLRRWADVTVAHGARVLAVTVGIQVVVPGVFYAVQLAFTEPAALLEPGRSALKRSAELTWGIRGRILKVYAVWLVLSMGLRGGVGMLLEGKETMMAELWVPGQMHLWSVWLGSILGMLVDAALLMGLVAMYRERVARAERSRPTTKPVGAPASAPEAADLPEPEHQRALAWVGLGTAVAGGALLYGTGQGYVVLATGLVVAGLAFAPSGD